MNAVRRMKTKQNGKVFKNGDGMHSDNEIMEYEKEISDAKLDIEIADIKDIVVGAINVASDIPEFLGQPGGTRDM